MDDGSGEGQLYATNDMVRQTMGLSQRDWAELNEVVVRTGQLVYAKGHQHCPQVSVIVKSTNLTSQNRHIIIVTIYRPT